MDGMLLELAEEPALWLPAYPDAETVVGDGYTFITSGHRASVERIRLEDAARAVAETRELARERGIDRVTWWAGERSMPGNLVDELAALGLEPDPETPELTSFAIDRQPDGSAGEVAVTRVDSFDEYLAALELDWEAWSVPAAERVERRAHAEDDWDAVLLDGRTTHYVGYLDDEPAGFARGVAAPQAMLLLGGSTLPHARGRGVYTALVHARWDDTLARGVPHIAVSAGAMSAPILERLGFRRIGRVCRYTDRL